ncbi:MAG: protein phosphatase 2C domain-containing protein [Pseudomonadota bacterium]
MRRCFELLDACSVPGSASPNEDHFGFTAEAAWVLDGVTANDAPDQEVTLDTDTFVHRMSASFADELARDPAMTTLDLLNAGVKRCQHDWGRTPSEGPATVLVMARIIDQHIELTAIGDCSAWYMDKDHTLRRLKDRSVEPYEQRTLDKLVELQRHHPDASVDELKPQLADVRRKNQERINTSGGYSVLRLEKVQPHHLVTRTIPFSPGMSLLLTSDGLDRYVDVLRIGRADAFFTAALRGPLHHVLQRVRTAEAGDSACRRFTRTKVSDDATGVVIRTASDNVH